MTEMDPLYSFINEQIPERCKGCLTALVSIRMVAGCSEVLGDDEADKLIDDIEKRCTGHEGKEVNPSRFVPEDGTFPLIPLGYMLDNPDCPSRRY
jgi:hypothetical protein